MAGSVIPKQHRRDVIGLRKNLRKLASQKFGKTSSPTFGVVTLSDLTASRMVWTNADKQLASRDLSDMIAGTTNQITVTDDGDGSVTLSISEPLVELDADLKPTDATYTLGYADPVTSYNEEIAYDTNDDTHLTITDVNWGFQSFTTVGAFDIARVDIKIWKSGSPGTGTVAIYAVDGAGKPTGSALVSQTFDGDALSASPGAFITVTFASAYSLSAATKYAIVVHGSVPIGTGSMGWRVDISAPTYADGNGGSSGDSGSSWSNGGWDSMFRIDSESVSYTYYRYKNLYLSGNLDDGTNQFTIANVQQVLDWTDQDVQTTASPTFLKITTTGGRVKKTHRLTANTTLDATYHEVFCDTDGGAFTVTLPVGVAGTEFRIINTGSSGNNLTITPDGLELLLGVNSSFVLADGEALTIVYEATEGWY